jgi:PGF-CTERM protein
MSYRETLGVGVVLLALVAAGVAGTASAQAGAGPTPIDSCRTIADDGRYVLTSDIQDSNQTVCVQILSSDVVFDGQGHTIDGGPNTSESVGVKVNNSLTTTSNVTVTNVTTTGWTAGVYYLDARNGTIRNVNASANRRHGVLLRAASDTRLVNVTAVNNGRWSLYAVGNTTNVTGINFETRSSNVSFTASNVALTGIRSQGSPPNRSTIGQYLGVTNTSPNASLRLAVNYTDQNVTSANVTERTLRMWAYDGNWSKPSGVNFVNISRNRVVANVQSVSNASTFAPAGVVETPTPTPTPTATATPETTTTAGTNGTNAATTTSSGSGPGFGIVLALVAVLAAALLVLRR